MKLLITGAHGFIGSAVVQAALAQGHRVVALVRAAAAGAEAPDQRLEYIHCDLGMGEGPDLRGLGIDAIIHLAAGMSGPRQIRHRDTVTATEQLLGAAALAAVPRVVCTSSIAVLDYVSARPLSLIDESVRPFPRPEEMGSYAGLKLMQERLLEAFAREGRGGCLVLRPGLVYDEERLSPAHAGLVSGRMCIVAAHPGEVPTVALRGLVTAIINAAEGALPGGPRGFDCVNVVDDALPRQDEYIASLRRRHVLPEAGWTVPWWLLSGLSAPGRVLFRALGQRARQPEMLGAHALAARIKPFRFSNTKAKALLGWAPGRQFS